MTTTSAARRADPIRVVFLLPVLDVGGAERIVLRSAVGLDRSRFVPTVVAMVKRSQPLADQLAAADVPTVVLDDGTRPRLRQLFLLRRWLRAHRPHLLLSYMFHANLAGRLMRLLGAVPLAIGSERSASESALRLLVNRSTMTWGDGLTVNSAESRRYWAAQLNLTEDRITVVPNGVDTVEFHPAAGAPEPVIGVLARLHVINGHDWLLDALAKLDQLVPGPWTCEFAGTGPEEAALHAKIQRLRLGARVRLRGRCSDPAAFLRSVMISVHPAYASGMPNAVLEAMACGLPVVATAVGGTARGYRLRSNRMARDAWGCRRDSRPASASVARTGPASGRRAAGEGQGHQ